MLESDDEGCVAQYSLETPMVAEMMGLETPTVVEMIGMGTSHWKGVGGFQQ